MNGHNLRVHHDDSSSSSDEDDDYNKLGDKLVRATNFLGKMIVKNSLVGGSQHRESTNSYDGDFNHDVDRYRQSVNSLDEDDKFKKSSKNNKNNNEGVDALNERYNEANEGNLYKCLRSVRHTDGVVAMQQHVHDDISFCSSNASDMSMPKIDEFDDDDDDLTSEDHDKPTFIRGHDALHRQASEISMHSNRRGSDDISNTVNRRGSNETENSAIRRRNDLHRQSSDISTHSIPSTSRRGSNDTGGEYRYSAADERRRRVPTKDNNTSPLTGSGTRRGLLRAMGLSRDQESSRSIVSHRTQASRRSSAMSTASDDNSEDNRSHGMRRWFGMGGATAGTGGVAGGGGGGLTEKISNSFTRSASSKDLQRILTEGGGGGMGDDFNTSIDPGGGGGIGIGGDNSIDATFTDHHAKSRAKFMQRNVSHATMNDASFRTLQKRMKEKGAITGNAVIHMLQEAAEEHAVSQQNNVVDNLHGELDSENGSITDLFIGDLDESESLKPKTTTSRQTPQQQQHQSQPGSGGRGWTSSRFMNNNASFNTSFNTSLMSFNTANNQNNDLNSSEHGAAGSTGAAMPSTLKRYLGRSNSQHEDQMLQAQEQHNAAQRLKLDPMFGSAGSDNNNNRPYITMPSRENKSDQIMSALHGVADQGQYCLLTIRGSKFVGKSKLLQKAIDTVQIEGLGYTVLSSSRTANDALTSFFAFREVMDMALRACDVVTQRSDESFDSTGGAGNNGNEDDDEEDIEIIVQRLIQRKILNKSDQLMIERILPSVMNNQLLSLLKGRNPTALTKDIVASLFKIMIPLQPVMLVFEADGDDCDIDPSSWDLIEELLLSAGKQCPQMLIIAVSRHSLEDVIPTSIVEKHHVDVEIEPMTKLDTECYIRALFCDANCIDRNMQVDSTVLDGIYDRAKGCALFTERIVLWSQRKEVIEVDETRNAVALNMHHHHRNHDDSDNNVSQEEILDTLPVNLNEEILEVINNLPHHLLDALKMAACIGITFDISQYQTLKDEQHLHDSLQELIASHGIFDESNGHYKWKHVAVYEAVESIIISNERIEIQGRIADSLRDLPDIHKGSAQYARHYVMAERWDKAFDQYMESGKKLEEKLDFMGAVGMYQQAKLCLTKSRKKPSLRRKLSPHAALGWCLRELVRYEDAEMELEFCLKQTMAVPERRRNSQYKEIELDVVTTLATLKQAQSKYSQAMEMYERALPIARANKEKHSRVWLAHHVASCAEIHRKSGDLEQAKGLHTEALGYRELAVEEKSCTTLELSLSFTQLGCTMSGLGDHSSAYTLHKKALAARVEHLDFYHSLVSESLNYCADALQALGRGEEGIPLGMHAVKIRKFVFGPHHPAYAHALSVLASCYHSVGRSFDSLGLLEECLEICEKAFSKNHANMIPNLMLYGSVLGVSGNYENAMEVYQRALSIHKMNFKEGQNAKQLTKLENAMRELSKRSRTSDPKAKASLEMPIPKFEPESSKTHVVVCADIGHRASDEYMLSVAASLQQMGSMKLVAFIAVRPPQMVRANIARGALDSLLLSNVPVAYSGVVSSQSSSKAATTATFNADYGKSSPHVSNTGVELLTRALLQAPGKSLVIMCTSCLGDVSEVIDTHRDIFALKVKQVVVIGSVKPVKRKSFIEPDSYGGEQDDAFAQNVYKTCQDLKIPTVTLSKDISRGFPFPSANVDDLTSTNHMVSTKIQRSEEMYMNGIWELIKQLKQEARSYRTPKSLDIKSFYKYTLGGKGPNTGQHNIWQSIKSINLELTIGLLSCISVYQDAHFRWETHQVNGVEHKICRHANAAAGIIKPEALSNEIHMLIGFALRNSLLNTSC